MGRRKYPVVVFETPNGSPCFPELRETSVHFGLRVVFMTNGPRRNGLKAACWRTAHVKSQGSVSTSQTDCCERKKSRFSLFQRTLQQTIS
jgi:hypothetical protein